MDVDDGQNAPLSCAAKQKAVREAAASYGRQTRWTVNNLGVCGMPQSTKPPPPAVAVVLPHKTNYTDSELSIFDSG